MFKYPSYPPGWSSIDETANIQKAVEGRYQCRGEVITSSIGEHKPVNLGQILIREFRKGKRLWCDSIKIKSYEEGVLEIYAYSNNKMVVREVLEKDKDYEIAGARIELSSETELYNANVGGLFERSRFSITVNKNADIIVQATTSDVMCLFCLVPIIMSGQDWARFERIIE